MYLLCDITTFSSIVGFSNSARRMYTQLKKAELLGGLGKKQLVKKGTYNPDLEELLRGRHNAAEHIKKSGDAYTLKSSVERLTKLINKERKKKKYTTRGYVDAAQIARRGTTTPIKANTYIDRAAYATNPQDNTVLAATINKIDKNTRKTGNEYGTTLYKDDDRLKASRIVEGDPGQVYSMSTLPKNKEAIIDIHSHPDGVDVSDVLSVIPSKGDLSRVRSKTPLLISPQMKGRTITKYRATTRPFQEDKKFTWDYIKGYRKQVRKAGGDYTVITPNKNQ